MLVTAAATTRAATSDRDRKSTRLNSSHRCISYAVFCLKKKHTARKTSFASTRRSPCQDNSLRHTHRTSTTLWRTSAFCCFVVSDRIALFFFFLNNRGPPEISPLPLHTPLPF